MTPDQDLSARLKLHDDGATPGKWGQYNPCFMDEAKDAQPQEWDTSHDVSGVKDGKRWKVAHYKHADDAAFAEILVNAYRSGQLITLADHQAAVQAAVAKAVEAERALVKAAEWETPDHTTMAHMLGMSAAELSVDLCRLGLFPAVGVDDSGQFVLGPFSDASGTNINGSAGVHWSDEKQHYYWSAYIEIDGAVISGHWPIDTIPDEIAAAIRSRGVAG